MKSKLNEITKASHKYKIHIWKKRLKKILSFKTEWIIGLKNLIFGLNSENLQRFTFVLIEENEFFKRWKPVFVVPFYLSLKRKKKKEISETSNRVFQNKNRSIISVKNNNENHNMSAYNVWLTFGRTWKLRFSKFRVYSKLRKHIYRTTSGGMNDEFSYFTISH